jgi:hypothetical protein
MTNWANMANITQMELAVLTGAVLLLFVAPALLSWADERRRRRAQRAAISAELAQTLAAPSVESVVPALDEPSVDTNSAPTADLVADSATGFAPVSGLDRAPMPPAASEPESAPASVPTPAPSTELLPLSGSVRHRFRLDDLHRAQLTDWPPATIRNDAERSRLRLEAEQAATAYAASLTAVIIASPYPARAQCLGAADADAAEVRLSFLLFPVVWPISQNQAVAQAVFRIDRATGDIRGWVDALRPQELSEENRHEIREAGGEA